MEDDYLNPRDEFQNLPIFKKGVEIDWVAGFNKWDYVIDRWGLFNPPGVGPFDKDPDDNIPMSEDFFDGDEN